MNFLFIPLQEGAAPAGGGSGFLIMMLVVVAIMYFFMIRPQQKRQKELNKFRNSLEKGQKIITAGGIYGVIKEVKDTTVLVEVDSDVTLRVDKSMVVKDTSDLTQGK
jgi:preprotein translocase subunit YajC